MVKSAEEIEVVKHGARIGDLGGETIRDAILEGISEDEVALVGTEAMVHEIARTLANSEIRDTWGWLRSGVNTDGAHNWATTRKLRRGDILSLSCFPKTSGYYTALERTLFLGQPDERSVELWNINVEVHRRGLELIRPGAVCKDIAAEPNEICVSHGLLPNRTFGQGMSPNRSLSQTVMARSTAASTWRCGRRGSSAWRTAGRCCSRTGDYADNPALEAVFPDGFLGWDVEHGGVLETSLMLRLHPGKVDMSRAPVHLPAELPPYDVLPEGPARTPGSGCLSSPAGATAERGELLLHTIRSGIARAITGEPGS